MDELYDYICFDGKNEKSVLHAGTARPVLREVTEIKVFVRHMTTMT